MKYNFDKVHDRIHDPYSYSMKYAMHQDYKSEMTKSMGARMGYKDGKVPDDALTFFLADMDFDIAPAIVEACHKAADFPNYGYTGANKAYYEAVKRWFHVHFDWDFDIDDIIEYHGTHPGVADAVKKLTNPGAGVIVFTPSYGFDGDITPLGRKFVGIDFIEHPDHSFTVDWDAFEKAAKDKNNEALIIVQPHNPLGFCYTVEEMKRIADICRANNVYMIADMVHLDIARKGVHPVPLAKAVGPEMVVSLTGLAKTFNIAGLSVSNMIIQDPKLKEKLSRGFSGFSPFSVAAATAAYTQCDDWVAELNEYIDSLVDYSCDFISKNFKKLKVNRPEASYVLYLDFRGYGLTSEQLDERICGKAHLVLSNGSQFGGGHQPELWRRMCLTSPMADVKEALNRLKDAFADLEK